ncbi:unnamed protein product [Diatraea saccharalis]|uniref:Riboflavin transporter n=1 Tax=Diatraea saccharalis TaxID=40085 RepID=A0A9N9WCL4_9NEOP|nr:unnamed protein product [Diatraea saccharalis]
MSNEENSPCLGVTDTKTKMWGVQRRVALDLAMMGWGLGTWLGVNGLYVQLPLLVERLPEGWALPASMTLAVQLANSGPLLYAALRRFVARLSDTFYIYVLLVIGALALLLNAFLHPMTVFLGDTERSVPFLALTFFAGLVGCTSSVLFYPYLRYYREVYLATYLVGEGLSGLIPSILALVQGIGGEPECVPAEDGASLVPVYPPALFDSTVFIVVLSCLAALSLACFTAVDRCEAFRSERVTPAVVDKTEEPEPPRESLLQPRWVALLVLMVFLNALMNGVMPSLQSYSCMPYGTRVYHLAVTLATIANPLACLAGVWLRPVPVRALAALLAATLLPLGYIVATALLSPAPPLVGTVGGEFLVVTAWVAATGALSYARMWGYARARGGGARGMRAAGGATQAGSALGSLALFLLVNYSALFAQPDVCPQPSLH